MAAVVWLYVGQFCHFLRSRPRFLENTLLEVFTPRSAVDIPELTKNEVERAFLLGLRPYRAQSAFVGHLRQVLSVDLEHTASGADPSAGEGNAIPSHSPDEDAMVTITVTVTDDRNA